MCSLKVGPAFLYILDASHVERKLLTFGKRIEHV